MFKQSFFALSFLLVMLFQPSLAYAELKVGYFNFRQIIDNVPQTQEARKKLEAEFAPKKKKISDLRDKIKAMKTDLEKNSVVLSEEDLVNKQRTIRADEREYKLMYQEYNEDVQLRQNQEMSGIQKLVYETAQAVSKDESFDLLLSNKPFFASPKIIDITPQILKKLSAK